MEQKLKFFAGISIFEEGVKRTKNKIWRNLTLLKIAEAQKVVAKGVRKRQIRKFICYVCSFWAITVIKLWQCTNSVFCDPTPAQNLGGHLGGFLSPIFRSNVESCRASENILFMTLPFFCKFPVLFIDNQPSKNQNVVQMSFTHHFTRISDKKCKKKFTVW